LSSRIAHERLLRICFGDYEREIVLVAELHTPQTGARRILGVGRLNKVQSRSTAEVAILVADEFQARGLGFQLLSRVVQVAREEKLTRVRSEMLHDNLAMQILSKRVGFELRSHGSGESIEAVMDL
jgi:acetyltransferase